MRQLFAPSVLTTPTKRWICRTRQSVPVVETSLELANRPSTALFNKKSFTHTRFSSHTNLRRKTTLAACKCAITLSTWPPKTWPLSASRTKPNLILTVPWTPKTSVVMSRGKGLYQLAKGRDVQHISGNRRQTFLKKLWFSWVSKGMGHCLGTQKFRDH